MLTVTGGNSGVGVIDGVNVAVGRGVWVGGGVRVRVSVKVGVNVKVCVAVCVGCGVSVDVGVGVAPGSMPLQAESKRNNTSTGNRMELRPKELTWFITLLYQELR
jgi:hypothetical protein